MNEPLLYLRPTGQPVLALSVVDAARAVSVSRDTLDRAIRRGELVARWPNTKPLIRIADLEAWLESLPTHKP